MFEGFTRELIEAGEVDHLRPPRRQRPAAAAPARPPADPRHVAPGGAPPRRATSPSCAPTCAATATAPSRPRPRDHEPYSKRAMARDHGRADAKPRASSASPSPGHDRGGRVRLPSGARSPRAGRGAGGARHRPDRRSVSPRRHVIRARLLALVLPRAALRRCPERVIGADPDAFYFRRRPLGARRRRGARRVPALLLRSGDDPRHVRGLPRRRLDRHRPRRSRSRRRQADRVAPSWRSGARAARSPRWYDVLEIWRAWADDLRGHALDCGHYLPEEAPEETLAALQAFLADARTP